MKIVDIKKKGNKAIITKDDGSTLELDLQLTENISDDITNLDEQDIYALQEKSEYYATKNSALRFLARRSHSIFEIRQKLLKKEFNESTIDVIINELIQIGYLNDQKFAEAFVEARINYKYDGLSKIKAQLYKRGIAKDLINEIISRKSEDLEEELFQNALELAKRKQRQIISRSSDEIPKQKLKEKLTLYLVNKGYSFTQISQVLKETVK